MRSDLAQWLDEMQHVADAENVTVAARHIELLMYYHQIQKSPAAAFEGYKAFLLRWNAITQNGKYTETQ